MATLCFSFSAPPETLYDSTWLFAGPGSVRYVGFLQLLVVRQNYELTGEPTGADLDPENFLIQDLGGGSGLVA